MKSILVGASLLLVCGVLACASGRPPVGDQDPGAAADPCEGKTLPKCAAECAAPPGQLAGEACSEGERCGNNIGDECTCASGTWSCSVHAPLGGPGVCNATCR